MPIDRAGIKLRLLALVLLAALPVFVLEVCNQLRFREQRMEQTGQEILEVARLIAAEQNQFFENARSVLATYLQAPAVQSVDRRACDDYLMRLVRQFPDYTGFGVATPDGRIVCSSAARSIGQSVAARDYFRETSERKGFAVGNVIAGPVTGKKILGMALPLLDEAGEIRLVGVLSVDLERLSATMTLPALQAGSALLLLDEKGRVLGRAPGGTRWIGEPAPDGIDAEDTDRERIRPVEDVDGVRRLYGFTTLLKGEQIRIGVGVPIAPLYAEANRQFLERMAPLVAVFLVAATVAWIGGEISIRRPLKGLQHAINRIAGGDLAARTSTSSNVPEFARLGQSFDAMAKNLESREIEVQRADTELRKALADKELLLKEMNHRVKNGLQLVSSVLSLQAGTLDDPEARRQLAQAQARVISVARVHQRLYQTDRIGMLDFGQYLRELCSEIVETLGLEGAAPRLEVEAARAELPADHAVHLALVANELITNALKHAYPQNHAGSVEVRFETQAGEARLEVADHGVGLSYDTPAAHREGGLGMRLVETLVAQLQGRLEIDRKPPGARFTVILPA